MSLVIPRLLAALCALGLLALAPARAEPAVTVFAAASLAGALEEAAEGYNVPVTFAYGGSGTMARQVAAGAPADVIILAHVQWRDWLTDQGMTGVASVATITSNRLAMVVPADPGEDLQGHEISEILGRGRLAMGQRDAVPAGGYARQWLTHLGLWDAVQSQLAETDNVRAALALVARGDAPLGIVYASDAAAEPRVAVLRLAPQEAHDPITYPALAMTPAGETFLAHLSGPEAQAVFTRRGFSDEP